MPRGLKAVRRTLASGQSRLYWYHRATGKALRADPLTPEGLREIAALDDASRTLKALQEAARGSFAWLWDQYTASEDWRRLRPRTRSDYQAVRDWVGEAAAKPLACLTAPDVYALRDKAARAKGRRFGNYVVQVLRLTLAWGGRRGLAMANPAERVESIRRPSDARKVNRAWSQAEVEAFMDTAPPQLRLPFALGLFAGMRQGDALMVTWSAYDGSSIRWRASKNGEDGVMHVAPELRRLLDIAKAKRGRTLQIAVNSRGDAWSASGFRASFFKRLRRLEGAGLIRPGCTFHGLRHTVATFARDAGESESRVAAGIGDRSPAMAAVYGRDADRTGAQSAVLDAVQKRFANAIGKWTAK